MSWHSTGKDGVVKRSLYTVVSRFGCSVGLHGMSRLRFSPAMVWMVGTAKPNLYKRTTGMRARVGIAFLQFVCLEGSDGFWCEREWSVCHASIGQSLADLSIAR